MRIDLHAHSRASDGTQTPTELVHAAREAGLDVLALTDHDTSEGWAEAADAASEVGVALVRGMEISTRHNDRSVHLLAYLPDPTHRPLVEHLARILDGRNERVPRILAALRRNVGIDDVTEHDVRRLAGDTAATGRPHVADALVAAGHATDRGDAFDRLLSPGRPGYVERYAADLAEMVRVVREAGGVPVLAHPWGRHERSALPPEDIAALVEVGLVGLEVDHQDHDDDARRDLRGLAADLDLVVTGSSDHHGLGKSDHDLGCNTTAPDQFERLLATAAEVAAASGRRTPEVLTPGGPAPGRAGAGDGERRG